MSNVEDFVKYQYEFAELTGITPTWSAFYDDGMATDATGFYIRVYMTVYMSVTQLMHLLLTGRMKYSVDMP